MHALPTAVSARTGAMRVWPGPLPRFASQALDPAALPNASRCLIVTCVHAILTIIIEEERFMQFTVRRLALTALALLSLLLTAMAPAAARSRNSPLAADDPAVTVGKTASAVSGCRRYEATLTVTGNPPARSTDTVLVIDASQYMGYGSPSTSLAYAKQAAIDLATQILADRTSRVAVVSYRDIATLRLGLTADLQGVKDNINSIGPSGSSNMKAGFDKAATLLQTSGRSGVARAIVLLSGTCANRSDSTCMTWPAEQTVCTIAGYQAGQSAQGQGTVYTVGFLGYIHSAYPDSEGVARDTLQRAQNGGYYETYSSLDTSSLYNAIVHQGAQAATEAVVTDQLSPEFELVAGSLAADGGTVTASDGAITWDIGALGKQTLTLRYQVTARTGYQGVYELSDAATLRYTSAAGVAGQSLAFPNPGVSLPYDLSASAGPDQTIVAGGSTVLGGAPVAVGGMGPYTYHWQPETGLDDPAAANPQASPSATTVYTVTVTDAAGCVASDQVLVSVINNVAPEAADDSASTCQGEPVEIDVLANDRALTGTLDPSTVTVTAGPDHGSATPDAQGMVTYTPAAGYAGPDSFQYTVRDDQGTLSNPATVSLTVYGGPVVTIERSDDPCAGQVTLQAQVSGGAPPYEYLWRTGGQTLAEGDTCFLTGYGTAGTVDLQVRDSHGCVTTTGADYAISPQLAVQIEQVPSCAGSITFQARAQGGDGSYQYAWEVGDDALYDEGTLSSLTIEGFDQAGTVQVRVMDGQGCAVTASDSYALDPELGVEVTRSYDPCVGRVTFTAAGNGGSGGYWYAWDMDGDGFDDGAGATLTLSGYGAVGDVRVQVTDSHGCTATASGEYRISAMLTASLERADDPCAGQATFTASASGGSGSYQYAWDADGDGEFDDGAGSTLALGGYGSSGTVWVRVTDGEGCAATASETYRIDSQLEVSLALDSLDACSGQACFSATATGGDGRYAYQWDLDADGTYDDAAGLSACYALPDGAQTVQVRVTDGKGCIASAERAVTVAAPAPQLAASMAASLPRVHGGDSVVYSYAVTNTGACPLLQVALDDSRLGPIALSGLTDEDGDGALNDLAAGARATGTAQAVITASVSSTAMARGENARGVQAVAQAEASVDAIYPCLDVQITGPTNAYEGDVITCAYTLRNCSADAALTEVIVSDGASGGVLWGPGDLPAGAAVSFAAAAEVPRGAPNPLVCTAVARGLDALGMEIHAQARHSLAVLRPLGYVFWDQDGDGRRGAGEPLLGGWRIYLLRQDDPATCEAMTLQDEGSPDYGWWLPPRDLPAGDYLVSEAERPGWVETYPAGSLSVYSIHYRGDGAYDLLSARPDDFDGLSFGNVEGPPDPGDTATPTPSATPTATPTGTPTPSATPTATPSATPTVGRWRVVLPLVSRG